MIKRIKKFFKKFKKSSNTDYVSDDILNTLLETDLLLEKNIYVYLIDTKVKEDGSMKILIRELKKVIKV